MIQPDQGLMIILISAILIICYFAPLNTGIESFANLINPQGSYRTNNTFNPGSDVEQWRINKKLYEPGPRQSLNFQSVQSQFPYNRNLPEAYNDDQIGLIKSDGVIVGGYMPQILRPFDSVTANPSKGSDCKWPCYSDKKFQQWCSEENAINYHAMRPLIAPNQWNKNLKKMFNLMLDKKGPSSGIPEYNQFEKVDTAVFCTESQQALMSWLMQKVAVAVNKMPEMQKNGPWKSERFVEMDVQMYQFVNPDSSTYFKIIFQLFNPLRSVATLVVATIFVISGQPSLVAMDFVNEGSMGDYMEPQNGFGPITGHNVTRNFDSGGGGMDIIPFEPLGVPNTPEGMQLWESNYKKNPNEFDWNYQNTLEVQKFNKEGFHSNVPGDNIKIEGGVPDSLKKVLRDRSNTCKEDNLMSCMTPGYTGITGVSAKSLNEKTMPLDKAFEKAQFARMDGSVKNVYANPSVVYSAGKEPIALRAVETAAGTIYI
jgi:hypothetical protein